MKTKYFVALLLALSCLCVFYTDITYAVSWRSDINSALIESGNSGKPIMVDFYTDWCGWCKRMDKDTYENTTVYNLAQSFICVKINAETDPETARRYRVRGYPTILFLNSKGDTIGTVGGYMPPDKFAAYMQGALNKAGGSAWKKSGSGAIVKGYEESVDNIKGLAAKAKKNLDKVRNHNLQLDGIILEPKPSKAIINGEIVKVGDTVGGAKVISIGKNKVELALIGGKKLTLKID